MKRILSLLCLVSIILAGCSGKASVSELPPADRADAGRIENSVKNYFPRHRSADHEVLVMLGPDYANRPAILEALITEYGLAGYGGMVLRLMYPESFKDGSRTRLSVLTDRAKESAVTVVVTVGAPAGTVNELNRIRAAKPGIKIISLFPLDETLPVEAVSDLVEDYAVPEGLLADENKASATGSANDSALGLLVLASVLAEDDAAASVSPKDSLAASLDTARGLMKIKKTGPRWTLSVWTDPDIGLKSRNHLVLGFDPGVAE